MFKRILSKILKKPTKLLYYSSLKRIIAEDNIAAEIPKNVIIGPNCSINPSAILICLEDDGKIEFEGDNYIGRNVEIGTSKGKIVLGSNTSIQDRCILLGDIDIGRYCVFAPNVYLSSGRHYYNFKPEYYIKDQDGLVGSDEELSKKHSKKIIIEDDCWLGINVVVMAGVKIGKGSVIGANSVVTKDVAPYSVMTGSPATLIKKRLNFELKENINYLNDADLPYFYSGFHTNYKTLVETRKEKGISVMKHFSTYLNSEGKKTITLKIKSSCPIKLNYFNQIKEIQTNDYKNIVFEINHVNIHSFDILLDKEAVLLDLKNSVFIQSISTQ